MFKFIIGLFGLLMVAGTADHNPDFGVPYILLFGTLTMIIMSVGIIEIVNKEYT